METGTIVKLVFFLCMPRNKHLSIGFTAMHYPKDLCNVLTCAEATREQIKMEVEEEMKGKIEEEVKRRIEEEVKGRIEEEKRNIERGGGEEKDRGGKEKYREKDRGKRGGDEE